MASSEVIPQTIASPAPQRRSIRKKAVKKPSSEAFTPFTSPTSGRRRKDVGDYWLGHTLGKGSSGRVKLGVHKESGQKVAIKIISKTHLASNGSVERAVKREIAVMKLIDHPNIISLIDVIDMSDSPNLYLILEYVEGGELFEHLVSQGRLCETEARRYFQQIIFGLEYCHRHLICHRDLKPENLLLDENKNIKIADFGMASLQPTGSLLRTSCGSPHYASPEIVAGIPYNGSASDIWSCGIILFALLCGHLPFDDENIRLLLNKVKSGKYRMPDHVSQLARDLITRILVIDPKERFTMESIQSHPWFTAEIHVDINLLPKPPTFADIIMPFKNSNQFDDRIIETLRVLWSDLSNADIMNALLKEENNMQKVTYVLLQRRANKYWEIGNAGDDSTPATPAKRRRPITICALGANKDSMPAIASVMSSTSQHSVQSKTGSSVSIIDANKTYPMPIPMKHNDIPDVPVDRNDINMELPPPVPPKPIIIRADLIYNQIRQDIETSVNLARKHSSLPPENYCISPLPTLMTSPNPRRQTFVNSIATPRSSKSIFGSGPHSQAPAMPVQQHLGIDHMVSPRAPQANKFSKMSIDGEKKDLDGNLGGTPDSISNKLDDHRRFTKSLRLLQRNKIDPIKSPKAFHRLSMPQTRLDYERKASQSTPFSFNNKPSKAHMSAQTATHASPVHVHAVLADNYSHMQSTGQAAAITSPRLSSWIPGLFNFKQPKICSIGCSARDVYEAVAKVKQVVEDCMDGKISERKDRDGLLRWKGEMRYRSGTKTSILRFKLQIILSTECVGDKYLARVDFIQQQGDSMALAEAVATVGELIKNYELDADLISTANGWLMSQDMQPAHQQVY